MKPAEMLPFHSSARRCPARCIGAAPAADQCLGQGTLLGAEHHRLEPAAALALDEGADRRGVLADAVGADHAGVRQDQHRLLVALAEGREPAELPREFDRAAPRPTSIPRPPDRRPMAARAAAASRSSSSAWNSAQPVLGEREPGRHRVAAAGEENAVLAGRDHRGTEIEARDRAAGAFGHAVREAATHAGRLKRSLQPPGDDADDAGMPLAAATSSVGWPCSACAVAAGIAASRIEASTCWRWRLTASRVAARARASTGSSQSSRRRPRSASLMRPAALMRGPSAKPSVWALGTSRICATSISAAMPGRRGGHYLQPLRHERTVEAAQRHHVADGRQGDEVEQRQQVGFRPRREEAGAAQRPHRRDRRQERDRRRRRGCLRPEGQSSRFGLTVAITSGGGPSDLWWSSTMMSALPGRGQHARRRRCRNRRTRPASRPPPTRPRSAGEVRAVALGHAVRARRDERCSRARAGTRHQRAAARAVDVVVAEHRDRLAAADRIGEAGGGALHVDEDGRIGQQRPQRRFEEIRGASTPMPRAASRRPTISGRPSRCAMPRPTRSSARRQIQRRPDRLR